MIKGAIQTNIDQHNSLVSPILWWHGEASARLQAFKRNIQLAGGVLKPSAAWFSSTAFLTKHFFFVLAVEESPVWRENPGKILWNHISGWGKVGQPLLFIILCSPNFSTPCFTVHVCPGTDSVLKENKIKLHFSWSATRWKSYSRFFFTVAA